MLNFQIMLQRVRGLWGHLVKDSTVKRLRLDDIKSSLNSHVLQAIDVTISKKVIPQLVRLRKWTQRLGA